MSLFGKRTEPSPAVEPDAGGSPSASLPPPAYGVVEAIQLMRSLPLDQNNQNTELVIKVVRATLGSLNVRVEDIIEDATRRQKSIQEGISSLHLHVAELEKQLDLRRREIAARETDLKETTSVKERLQMAERAGGSWSAASPPPTPVTPSHTPYPPLPTPSAAGRPGLPKPIDREDSGRTKSG
jgi:hypothetical protein